MKTKRKLYRDDLKEFADTCHSLTNDSSDKTGVLNKIAETCTGRFGEFFGPDILAEPDELSVNFIELLDQIVFEMVDSTSGERVIREYIIDDLYRRVSLYLDVFRGIGHYEQSLVNRRITTDDLVIIRHYHLDVYIGELTDEFYEQPALQPAILRTLLVFDEEKLLNFYYQVTKELHSMEVKSLALMGLKQYNDRFTNWDMLKTLGEELSELAAFVENFNTEDISLNSVPSTVNSLFFTLSYIEMNLKGLMKRRIIPWIFSVIRSILYFNRDSSFFTGIFSSIGNIILYFDIEYIQFLLREDRHMISFICVLDILPPPVFERMRIKLDQLGREFVNQVDELRKTGRIHLDDQNSNVIGYLYRKTPIRL